MCEHGLMSCYTQKHSPPPLSLNKRQTLTPAGSQCLLPVFFFKAQGNDCHLRWNSPLRDEIYKLWGETVGRQLWRRFIHHLFELLEGSSPWLVGKFQNGQFNLGRKGEFNKYCTHYSSTSWLHVTCTGLLSCLQKLSTFCKMSFYRIWILHNWKLLLRSLATSLCTPVQLLTNTNI